MFGSEDPCQIAAVTSGIHQADSYTRTAGVMVLSPSLIS